MTPIFPVPIKLPELHFSKRCECLVGTYCLNHRTSVSGHDPDFLFA